MTDNVGSTDGHRKLNYLVVRYLDVYGRTAERFVKDFLWRRSESCLRL